MQFPQLNYINLFDWVWYTSAKASILIVLLLLIKFVFKNRIGARLNYLLWSIVIISLVLPWTPQSTLSLYNLINTGRQQTAVIFGGVNNYRISNNMVAQISSEVKANAPDPITSDQSQSSIPNSKKSIVISLFIHKLLYLIWVLGVVSFITVTVGVNRRFAMRIQGQPPVVDIKLLTAFNKARDNLNVKKEIPLILTEHIASPSLYGLVHPQLLIPVGMLEELSSEQLSHVFLHELLHYKRKDLWVKWITQVLLAIHWFNPLAWFAFSKLREDQEMACDAVTLEHLGTNDAKNYAYTLITLLEKKSNSSRIVSLASLSGAKSLMGRRITMIKGFRKTSIKWSLLVVGVVVALAFVTLSNAKASTTNSNGAVVPVANVAPKINLQTVKIEPNKLVSNDGWSLSITKVMNLGSTNGWGWHSPFKESDLARSYGIFFTLENTNGLDKAFLPKGKVLGVIGLSGKFYEFPKEVDYSLDNLYNNGISTYQLSAKKAGEPYGLGIFKFSVPTNVDLKEEGIVKVIYQDENGKKFELPIQ